jgi:hypothetical protein
MQLLQKRSDLAITATCSWLAPNFGGRMDDIRVYNRTLSAQEVKDFYEEGGYKPQNALNLNNDKALLSSASTGKYASVPEGVWFKDDFTVETWINIKSKYNKWERIFDFGNGAGLDNVLLSTDSGNGLPCFSIYEGASKKDYIINTPIPLNTWTHVAISYNSTTMNASVYYNGVLIQTITNVSTSQSHGYLSKIISDEVTGELIIISMPK